MSKAWTYSGDVVGPLSQCRKDINRGRKVHIFEVVQCVGISSGILLLFHVLNHLGFKFCVHGARLDQRQSVCNACGIKREDEFCENQPNLTTTHHFLTYKFEIHNIKKDIIRAYYRVKPKMLIYAIYFRTSIPAMDLLPHHANK